MATKLAVIQKRVEIKDYQDVAAMVKYGTDLSKGLSSAQLLYGKDFIKKLTFPSAPKNIQPGQVAI